jgi:hypothetical protein
VGIHRKTGIADKAQVEVLRESARGADLGELGGVATRADAAVREPKSPAVSRAKAATFDVYMGRLMTLNGIV